MAAELVETTRLYARSIAQIQPEWLERVGAHLLKKSLRRAALGKAQRRRCRPPSARRCTAWWSTASAASTTARSIPPRRARSSSAMRWSAATSTRARRSSRTTTSWSREIENLEHKSRRLDVLVDDELIAAFYDKLIPADICNGAGFEKWYKEASANESEAAVPEPRRADAARSGRRHHRAVPEADDGGRHRDGADLSLRAGRVRDGVTLTVPLFALNQVSRGAPNGWCRAC